MSDLAIKYMDKEEEFALGSKAFEVLKKFEALDSDTIAARFNGQLIDFSEQLEEPGQIEAVVKSSDDGLAVLRHSTGHMMAQAIMRLYPDARLAIGPTVENGFYYDVDFGDTAFSQEDLPKIEKEMKAIAKKKLPITRKEVSRDEALEQWRPAGEAYKVELIEDLEEDAVISTYSQGEFTDLCRGPHAPNTRYLRVFKLMSVAGAYWRGDEKNKMLTRIYGTAWPTKDEQAAYLKMLAEAEKRDHRKLGKQLDLFHISEEVGKGLPLWLPNGTVLRDELEKMAKEAEWRHGYQRVTTPEITKGGLYVTSGHLEHYKESMFPPMKLPDESEEFYMKPMNCPHHHMIFKARPRSYRDMPLRLAEYGRVYRFERSGELAGLLRVRGMCMNDAHIYTTEDQLKDEFQAVMQLHMYYYKLLGLKDYYMRLSLHDPKKDKFVEDQDLWNRAEKFCMDAMDELGMPYKVAYGEAAFYGPKVDVQFKNVVGREETNSTNQLDFVAAKRFDLNYIGEDGKPHRPVVIHRAPLGTHERFIAFLIEHFAGAFPTWLAPIQVAIIPVATEFREYAEKLREDLFANFVRVEIDDSSDTLNKKIRNAVSNRKIPNVLVLGGRERDDEGVTLRQYGVKQQQSMSYVEFKAWLMEQIAERKLPERDLV